MQRRSCSCCGSPLSRRAWACTARGTRCVVSWLGQQSPAPATHSSVPSASSAAKASGCRREHTHLHFKSLPHGCKLEKRVDKWVLLPVLGTHQLHLRGSLSAVLLKSHMSPREKLKYQRSPNTFSLHQGRNLSEYFLLGTVLLQSATFPWKSALVALHTVLNPSGFCFPRVFRAWQKQKSRDCLLLCFSLFRYL